MLIVPLSKFHLGIGNGENVHTQRFQGHPANHSAELQALDATRHGEEQRLALDCRNLPWCSTGGSGREAEATLVQVMVPAESRKLKGKWVKEGRYSRSGVAGLLDASHLLCTRSCIENQSHLYNSFFMSFFPPLCLFSFKSPLCLFLPSLLSFFSFFSVYIIYFIYLF